MGNVRFIGCLHLGHDSLARWRGFEDALQQDEYLIKNWNSVVKKKDITYILGDVTMENSKHYYLLDRLNGRKKVVLGNHDRIQDVPELLKYVDGVSGAVDYKGYMLTHVPIHPSEVHFYRANLHCVDTETEILTTTGWKKYNEISIGDVTYSLNSEGGLEEDSINNVIINENYNGDIVTYKSRNSHLVYTDEHRIIYKAKASSKTVNEILAKDLSIRTGSILLPCSGILNNQKGLDLSDDLLRLYISLVADGNITKYNLCRLNVSKKEKFDYFKGILDRLGIEYNTYSNKSAKFATSFRFPKELEFLNIKGLDKQLLKCNREQCSIILEAYSKTDGYINGTGVFIYTSKSEELGILSHLFTINGFRVNYSQRVGGFPGSGVNYSIAVYDKRFVTKTKIQKFTNVSKAENLTVWCVQTNNGNFVSRRNGETIITGNCHIHHKNKLQVYESLTHYNDSSSVLKSTEGKYWNVDAKLLDFTPKTLDELREIYQQPKLQ